MRDIVIRKVGVGSLGKVFGVWAAIIGLAVGAIGAVSGTVGVIANNNYSVWQDIVYGILIIIGGIIIYPIIMFLLGWVQGAIVAFIFNVVISGSGGLDLEIEELEN